MEKNEKPQEVVEEVVEEVIEEEVVEEEVVEEEVVEEEVVEEEVVEEIKENKKDTKKVEPYNSKEIPRNRYRPIQKTNATKVHDLEIYLTNLIHEKVNSIIQEEINIDKLSVDYSMDKRVLAELKVKLNSKHAYKDIITMYLIPILKKYSIQVGGSKDEIKQMMERPYAQHTRPQHTQTTKPIPNRKGNALSGRYRSPAGRDRDNSRRNKIEMMEKRKLLNKTRGGRSQNSTVLKKRRQTLIKKRGRK